MNELKIYRTKKTTATITESRAKTEEAILATVPADERNAIIANDSVYKGDGVVEVFLRHATTVKLPDLGPLEMTHIQIDGAGVFARFEHKTTVLIKPEFTNEWTLEFERSKAITQTGAFMPVVASASKAELLNSTAKGHTWAVTFETIIEADLPDLGEGWRLAGYDDLRQYD